MENADIWEHISKQGHETIDTGGQFSSKEEFRKALDILEGQGPSEGRIRASMVMGRTSALIRERPRFKL